MTTPDDTDQFPPIGSTGHPHRRRRLWVLLAVTGTAIVLVGGVIAFTGGTAHHARAAAGRPSRAVSTGLGPTSSGTAPTPTPASRVPASAQPSSTPASPATSGTGTGAAPGGQRSVTPAPPRPPTHSVTPQPVPPAPPTTPPPPPPPTTPPAPPFTAHWVSVPEPAAFAGHPISSIAQSEVTGCADGNNLNYCGASGMQWGGGCSDIQYSSPVPAGDGVAWAVWEFAAGQCTFAMMG